VVDWQALVERERLRYEDGLARSARGSSNDLAVESDADARQKQVVRTANAALGAGLGLLMAGDENEARRWLLRAAGLYRKSYDEAPPGSWGRLLGALKMRLLAGDDEGSMSDARWALAQGPAAAESPIGRYAAVLALLVLGEDEQAEAIASGLRSEHAERFPRDVADALAGICARDADLYEDGLARTLRSFETRDAYLEDVPIADTVLVLERLAARRGLAVHPTSSLLPA
jgi:hypothetical protein